MASITALQALSLVFTMLLLTTNDASRPAFTKLENEDGGGQSECWTAVSNIRSCSNKIIGFLLNGQGDLDKLCCVAISTTAKLCWLALVGALGYSLEAISFLQDYCEKMDFTASNISTKDSP